MGKKSVIFLFFILFSGMTVFGQARNGMAIGVAYQLDAAFINNNGFGNGALFSFKVPQEPIIFGIGFRISSTSFNISATADWWMKKQKINELFNLYLASGFYLGAGNGQIGLGLRVPVGLQISVLDPLDLFFEAAPRFGIGVNPLSFPEVGLMLAAGFRFWF